MAYGYKAHYGYYIDPNGQAHGTLASPYLDGKNINDCVLTDTNVKYFIPEIDDLPYPRDVVSESTNRETMRGRFRDELHTGTAPYVTQGIPDWRYFSLFPAQPSTTSLNDQDYYSYAYWSMCQITLEGNYSPFTIVDQAYKGNPFRWCPKLCKSMVSKLYGKVGITFVYLFTWGKLIDQFGNLYTVGSTGNITIVSTQINFFAMNRISCSSFSGGSTAATVEFMAAYKPANASATTAYKVMVYLHGGATYSWSVFRDLDVINTYVIGYMGFDTGNYDYKSEIGEDPDPYAQVGEKSKPGGGGGTGVIPGIQGTPIPGVGDLQSVIDLGLISAYTPDASQVQALANELWGTNFIQQISKVVNQPMDTIVTFHIVPLSGISEGDYLIVLGNYVSLVHSSKPSAQYHVVDCGSITIDEIWGSYLDWKCSISLFLPFIGSVPLKVDDVIGKTISVQYMVDILTGACVAYVIRDDAVIANFAGNCAFEIPLTGGDHTQLITGMIGVAGAAITGIATGGMTAPVAATAATSSLNVAMSKTNYQRSGGLGANTAYMGIKTPYLTVYVPNQCLPEDQNDFIGYPSYITVTLGSQHGYTEVYKSHVHINGASDAEIMEIETLLNQGVIIA